MRLVYTRRRWQVLQRFNLGLVVGKFAPLHRGHEWLIEQAQRQCQRLLLLSYTKPEFEQCDVAARRRWLAQRFPQHGAHVIDDAWLLHKCAQRGIAYRSLPENSADDASQQEFLAWLLRDVLQRLPDALFCSESYGPPCAAVLSEAFGKTVFAVVVDPQRLHMPISASQIRRDPSQHGEWLAPVVRAAFIRRIVLLGGESTGKTTLAAALAAHFKSNWVAEYGRELWESQNGSLSRADMLKIGHEQLRREAQLLYTSRDFQFSDTSPLTTLFYSLSMFGAAEPALEKLAQHPYDAVILCQPDFSFVQDGTRRDEAFRLEQQAWYKTQLAHMNCPVLEVAGDVAQRVKRVADWLSVHFAAPFGRC